MRETEFEGYWSEKEKELWKRTDWKARNYEELSVDGDVITRTAYFYSNQGVTQKQIEFQKYIRANTIYSPYYGPVYTKYLNEFMKENGYCYPSYDGHEEGPYNIHDRFETSEIADILSR